MGACKGKRVENQEGSLESLKDKESKKSIVILR
jgi:hypothetical protein